MSKKTVFGRTTILKYLQDYRYNSILVKSLITILLVLIFSFAIIMMLVINQMNKSIERELGTMSINAINKTQERIDTVMQEVVQISGQLSLDQDVRLMLLPDSNDLLKQNPMQAVRKKIESNSNIVDYIDSIYVYSSKNNVIVTNEDSWNIDEFSDMTWFDNLNDRIYEPARMVTRLKDNKFPYLISYIKPIRLTQMEFLGGIIVNIDLSKLDELVITNVEDTKENLMIVDERNNIIFSSNQDYLMKKIDELESYGDIASYLDTDYAIINDGIEDYVLTAAPSDYYNWTYASTVPVNTYKEYQQGFTNFFLLLGVIILVISISAALFISFYNYKPVMNILNLLKNPDVYQSNFEDEQGFHKDEAQEISLNIIRNIYSNQQLQKEMKNYMTTIDKAHITALQAQISPHFLYNTLENIRWRVIEKLEGDNEVSQIILKLSEMLRTSLDTDQQVITISEEIRNAQIYVDILQLRYGDKVRVEWEVEDAALNLPIPKIILQPVIENAVYHGIKPLRDVGIIKISVQKLAKSTLIRVADNGIGIKPEVIKQLNADMDKKYLLREDHIGVRNVNQRLKLLMGDEARMNVRSSQNRGTTVTIEVPFSSENE